MASFYGLVIADNPVIPTSKSLLGMSTCISSDKYSPLHLPQAGHGDVFRLLSIIEQAMV